MMKIRRTSAGFARSSIRRSNRCCASTGSTVRRPLTRCWKRCGDDRPHCQSLLSTARVFRSPGPAGGGSDHPPSPNLYYLLCYAWRHVREADIVRREELAGLDGTHHLLGKVLAEGTFRLIRGGIDRGYREVREDLAGIRGKLSVGETAKRALRARGRAACEFEELSHDVLHNRILRSTLAALLKLPDLDPVQVRPDMRTAYRKLEGISLVRLERRLFPRVQLDRNRHLYRFLMSICELIHNCLIVEERSDRRGSGICGKTNTGCGRCSRISPSSSTAANRMIIE